MKIVRISEFNNYSITEYGDVIPDKRQGSNGGKLKPCTQNSGYLKVNLMRDGKAVGRYIHHLVAISFIGDRPKGMVINHKDGCKLNNHYRNLEYVTSSENNRHAIKNGLRNGTPWLGKFGKDNHSSKSYLITHPNGKSMVIKGLSHFCREYMLNRICMMRVAQGKNKQHKGFRCEYIS